MSRSIDIVRRRRTSSQVPGRRRAVRSRINGILVMGGILIVLVLITLEGQRAGDLTNSPTISTGTSVATPSTSSPSLVIPSFETQGPTLPPTEIPTSSPSPQASLTPSPTPTPTVEKKNISISVFNGSGRAGEGNKIRLQLIEEGFTIRRLAVSEEQLTATTLYYQPGKAAEAAFVAGYLSDYKVELVEDGGQAIPDDLVIVVGQDVVN